MKKVLLVANIHKHFKAFHIPYIKLLKRLGCEVHLAAHGTDTLVIEADKQFEIGIYRSPFHWGNLIALRDTIKLIRKEKYDLIHCNTAMGGVIGRLASYIGGTESTKTLYTAHGFHFYKGGPLKYWILFYPVEKLLSRITDGIIVLNHEDLEIVSEKNFRPKYTFKLSGVGVDPKVFYKVSLEDKSILREKAGFNKGDFILIYTAEYIKRKNHEFLLKCAQALALRIPKLKILLAGRGERFEIIANQIESRSLSNIVFQLGFRKDISNLYQLSDLGISMSLQEGLPINIIEEMMCGLPIVCSRIRGHTDLVENEINGFLFDLKNVSQFVEAVVRLYEDTDLYNVFACNALTKAKEYTLDKSIIGMSEIYKKMLMCGQA